MSLMQARQVPLLICLRYPPAMSTKSPNPSTDATLAQIGRNGDRICFQCSKCGHGFSISARQFSMQRRVSMETQLAQLAASTTCSKCSSKHCRLWSEPY